MNKRTITINEPFTDMQAAVLFAALRKLDRRDADWVLTNVTTSNGIEALIIYYHHTVGWCIQTYEATT